MTPTTPVAILSLLRLAPAEDAAFSPLALSQRNRHPVQNPPPNQQHPWRRPVKDEAVVRRPVNVLTRRGRPRWGSREVWLIRSGGLEEGSGGTASQAVAWPRRW
jgi:hypothetical protein